MLKEKHIIEGEQDSSFVTSTMQDLLSSASQAEI